MTAFLIRTAINAGVLLLLTQILEGIKITDFKAALIAALVLGLANATVKPILQAIAEGMTCVLSCLTLGLSSLLLSWLINAALFYAAGQYLPGFRVEKFSTALIGALLLSICNALATALLHKDKKNDER